MLVNIEYKIYESQYYRHPVEIAKQITTDNDSGDIIVIGGDGTFNEVLNGKVFPAEYNFVTEEMVEGKKLIPQTVLRKLFSLA